MLAKNVETLKNMNSSTGKYAKWYVRIIDPKIIEYSFRAKGEEIVAKKFQRVLVSKDPSQYMLGLIPFDFKDRHAATKAQQKFLDKSVWELTTPGFDAKSRTEYNGCPLKSVLLLTQPTSVKAVPFTNQTELKYPSQGLEVCWGIKYLMAILNSQSWAGGSGSAKPWEVHGYF